MLLRACIVLLIALLSSVPSLAREVQIHVDVFRVQEIDGESVYLLSEFTAATDDFVLTGATGRFSPDSETMYATGKPDAPATLTKQSASGTPEGNEDSGETEQGAVTAFFISATDHISMHFEQERLRAEGSVTYRSGDTEAFCDILVVDMRDAILALVQELIAQMPPGQSREIVTAFFDALAPDARLVLLQGSVRVVRPDAELQAAWMVFEESDADQFISVARPDRPIELRVVIDDEA